MNERLAKVGHGVRGGHCDIFRFYGWSDVADEIRDHSVRAYARRVYLERRLLQQTTPNHLTWKGASRFAVPDKYEHQTRVLEIEV